MHIRLSSRSRHRHAATALFLAASVVAGLAACQSSAPDEAPTNQPQVVRAVLPFTDAWKVPDSLTWSLGSGPRQNVTSKTFHGDTVKTHFALPSSTTEIIHVQVWTAGMLSATVSFTQSGSSPELVLGTPVPNEIAWSLLKELPTANRYNRDSLHALYARHLVDGDLAYKGYPANRPTGIDSVMLLRAAVVYAVGKGPLDALAKTWSLGIEANGLHALVEVLVKEGKITASDTLKAFPPYPVRARVEVGIAPMEIGQAAAVTGVFEGDSGLTKIDWKVVQGSDDRKGLFKPAFSNVVDGSQTSWDLQADASFTLSTTLATPGSYTLVVWALDTKNRSDTSRVEFSVATVQDKSAPSLVWIAPTASRTLEFADSVFTVKVSVSDPSGVGSVTINDSAARNTGAEYARVVVVPVSGQGLLVTVKVQDGVGNKSTDTVRLYRKAPAKIDDPRIELLGPSDGSSVPFQAKSVKASWKVVDPLGKLDSVLIQGKAASRVDSTYSLDIDLEPTGKPTSISLVVFTRGSKTVTFGDRTNVTRSADTEKPFAKAASKTVTVPFDSLKATVSWTVTDNDGLGWVKIAGKSVTGSGNVYSARVDLPMVGRNEIVLLAADKAGNSASDTVVVTRKQDTVKPVVTKGAGALTRSVAYDTANVTVSWTVTDNHGVGSVKIASTLVTSTSSTYTKSVVLALGANRIIIDALDITGNPTSDTVTITRLNDTVKAIVASDTKTSLRAGTFWVNLTCATSGAKIYYTLDGSQPTEQSTLFVDSIKIDSIKTLKARGFASPRVAGPELSLAYNLAVVVSVAGGGDHALALMSDGSLWGFGNNAYNAFAPGLQNYRPSPVKMDSNVAQMSAGHNTSMWVKTDGSLWGIGQNGEGQLGDGTVATKTQPTRILLNGVKKVITSIGKETLILMTDGTLWGTGGNSFGELGLGFMSVAPAYVTSPKQLPGISGVKDMGIGGGVGYFIKSDNTYWTMGYHGNGGLGLPGDTSIATPTYSAALEGASTLVDPVMGGENLVGTTDGSLFVFGWNTNGQLGSGDSARITSPMKVALAGSVAQLAAGNWHSLVLTSNGTLWGCGSNNYRQLGMDGAGTNIFTPITMGVTGISAGYWSSYFIKTDGTLWGMGANAEGQLGAGTRTTSEKLVRVKF